MRKMFVVLCLAGSLLLYASPGVAGIIGEYQFSLIGSLVRSDGYQLDIDQTEKGNIVEKNDGTVFYEAHSLWSDWLPETTEPPSGEFTTTIDVKLTIWDQFHVPYSIPLTMTLTQTWQDSTPYLKLAWDEKTLNSNGEWNLYFESSVLAGTQNAEHPYGKQQFYLEHYFVPSPATPTPEPITLLLVAFGFSGLAYARWRIR